MEREQAVRLTQNLLRKMVEREGSDLFLTHGFPPAFARSSLIEADTLDLELIQTQCYHGIYFDASFGARYARLRRNATDVFEPRSE